MKKIFLMALAAVLFSACSDLEDNAHYKNYNSEISNPELNIVNQSSIDYIASRSDLSSMNTLFKEQGIYDMLESKGQKSTILVVKDENYKAPEGDADNVKYITNSHVSDIEMSPANLSDGTRLMMWHGKYVNVQKDELAQKEGAIVGHILFNNATLEEVIKTTEGYIYVISDMIYTPTSLRDYINELPEEYSEFKNMVLASGGREFDKANSKPIGVNNEGNTVYDTVWVYTNAFFDNVGFDMNSESLTATMLLPSNDVIKAAMDDAHTRLQSWEFEREDSIIKKWILKTAFFNKRYTPEQIKATDENERELKSIHNTIWRTDKQQVEDGEPTSLSNAVVYKVKKLYIPTNVLIYRLKDWFHWYEKCTADEKEKYFKTINLKYKEVKVGVDAWTPLPGVWPMHEDRVLIYSKGDDAEPGFQLDFTPIKSRIDSEGTETISPYLVPPGAYRLCMGFTQKLGMDLQVTVFADGVQIGKSDLIPEATFTTTLYHYDRGAGLSDGYPEGYNPKEVSHSKAANYDTDGGLIIDELVIPGDKPVQLTFRIESPSWNSATSITLNHWCLRPKASNY